MNKNMHTRKERKHGTTRAIAGTDAIWSRVPCQIDTHKRVHATTHSKPARVRSSKMRWDEQSRSNASHLATVFRQISLDMVLKHRQQSYSYPRCKQRRKRQNRTVLECGGALTHICSSRPAALTAPLLRPLPSSRRHKSVAICADRKGMAGCTNRKNNIKKKNRVGVGVTTEASAGACCYRHGRCVTSQE